jgi:hypothetical protein
MEEEPKVPSSNTKLLYFFINDYSLYNWYKNTFRYGENRIPLPFNIDFDDMGYQKVRNDPKSIIHPLLEKRLISDINISIYEGNLTSFDTVVYTTNSNAKVSDEFYWSPKEFPPNIYVKIPDSGGGYLRTNYKTVVKDNLPYSKRLSILSKNLNINKNVTCNVTCRFFVIGKNSDELRSEDDDELISDDDIVERYKKQFEIDKNENKLVFIGEDFKSAKINTQILDNLKSFDNAETKTIELPNNVNLISYVLNNLNNFDYFIESNRIYSDNENSSSVSHHWFRGGIRSIKKPTKKTKKTRKPRKKSRKSRKHKKSRKH